MNINKFSLVFYGTLSKISIHLVGKLMLAEVVALAYLPFINVKKLLSQYSGLRTILGGFLVLLLSQMLSDFFNDSTPHDYLRGWSLIIFSMVSILFFVHHLGKDSKAVLFYLVAVFFMNLFFSEGDLDLSLWDDNTNYFKQRFIGFLNPLTMLVSYYFYSNKKTRFTILILFAYGLICFVFDARSVGFVFIISALLLSIKVVGTRFSTLQFLVIGIILTIVSFLLYLVYVYLVLHHDFGGLNAITQLRMARNPYNPLELIYYGRTHFIVLAQAVLERPVWGYGSWGRDDEGYYANLMAIVSGSSMAINRGYIVAHSIFLGTWAYAGIIGFIATLFVYTKLFIFLFRSFKSFSSPILPIIIVLGVDALWNYFFSPIGHLRTSFPIFAAIITVEYEQHANHQ